MTAMPDLFSRFAYRACLFAGSLASWGTASNAAPELPQHTIAILLAYRPKTLSCGQSQQMAMEASQTGPPLGSFRALSTGQERGYAAVSFSSCRASIVANDFQGKLVGSRC